MRVKRGVVGPRRPGATSLSSHAGTEDVVGARPRKPTQFDDQRPGWDFTSGDVGKFKLTEEQVKARRALYTSKHLADAKAALAGRSAAKISVRPGKRETHRVVDKTDFEGSDAESRDLSPSPPRAAPRGRGAPGAGLGPVRFEDPEDASFAEEAENANAANARTRGKSLRPPLSHEAETSRGRRMLGEPPAWRNPRARVPFREARVRLQSERGPRKARALARAAGKGWAPTRAPEWNNPNGTGKAVRVPRERAGDPPGAPTVAFEEEFEQFKMMKLRERAANAAGSSHAGAGATDARRFARGGYAAVGSDEDVDEDEDDGSFRLGSDGVEQEEESEGERGVASPRASDRDSPPRDSPRGPPESTASLLKRHELIRREFGKETSPDPDPPERSSAFFDNDALDPTEREMARVFAGDGDALDGDALDGDALDGDANARNATHIPGTRRKDTIPAMTSSVPAALRFAPPPEPEPSRNLTLWPTPFGRPANDVPNRAVREDVGISYPVPPLEERNLPKYSQRNEGRKKGLASLAFARSVGTGTLGAAGFAGAGGGHAPDPRALRANEGVETLGLGPLPPGFLASREIQQLAETLARKGDYEGGGGRVDRDIAAGRGGGDTKKADEREEARADSFRKRASAAKRAVTSNVEAGLDGRSPAGGTLVDLVPEEDAEAEDNAEDKPHTTREGQGPATRAPVTSGSQTMSLNAHARMGVYD